MATGIPERSEYLTIRATVSDVEPLPIPFFAKDAKIVPDVIIVEYGRDGFEPWKILSIKVYGGKLLKSGKASDNRLSRHDVDLTFFGRMNDDTPVWAREFAELNKPLDSCAIAVVLPDSELNERGGWSGLGTCPEPPVAVVNIHRRPEEFPSKSEVFGKLVAVGRTVQEPRCRNHLAMDAMSAVPFSMI